ncbi:MAG: hypothetical protein RJA70_268 [Pseudomonadota bacterium]|jgi:DNA-binding transcriptional regulator YiaG
MCEYSIVDFNQAAAQLVRAVRGKRSQAWVCRRLKYTSNVIYTWETGRNAPSALQFLTLAECCGFDTRTLLADFYVKQPLWLNTLAVFPSAPGVAAFLRDQRGQIPIGEWASSIGASRFALSRWLKGTASPKLPELLKLIHFSSRRLLDFVALFTYTANLSAMEGEWQRADAALRSMKEAPWSQAVLRCFELPQYASYTGSAASFVVERLRLSQAQAETAISLLASSGQLEKSNERWLPTPIEALDAGRDPSVAEGQRRWWATFAASRVGRVKGMCAYNVCAVSSRDLARLKELQRGYLRQARAIIAESAPERVVLIMTHVLALDDFRADPE